MINDLQEVQWAYLLDPAFELVNTAGKPLTDGYIEVYIHGTRNKYYCASDFDGTLHPFKIPLDALGANIVLASPAHSYDIYVYNKFGSLVMSRYNIQPKTGSGEIVHDDITVSSDDGSVHIVTSGQTNYDLSIQDTIDRVDVVESSITNLATSIEEITNVVTAHDVDIEELKANKKDKQEEYVAIGGPTKTITKVEQDEDGKMTVTYADIDLPQEVPNVELTSPNGTINIASSIDIATNTKTFEIDVDGHEPDWHYWTGNNAWTTLTNGTWKDINRPTMGTGSYPHSWTPEVKLGVYDAKADFTVTFHNPNNSYTVPNQIIQIGFRAKLVGKHNADAIHYIDLGAWTYDPSLYTTESYQYNFAQESLRQNYSTSKILYVPNYAGDTEFYIYYQAALLNTDGSQHVTAIDPVCRAEITYFGYHEVVGSITGTASGGTTLYAGSGIDIDEDRINVNIGEGLTIVNNNVSIDKSVVLAKDNLVAGDNITITASGDNLIINATDGGATYTAGDGIDITNDVISVDNSIARTSDLEAYIPYSASGVELPNSNFEIAVDGQAYKTHIDRGSNELSFERIRPHDNGDSVVTQFETGVTYTLTVQGALSAPYMTNYNDSSINYAPKPSFNLGFADGVCTFTWPYETATVATYVSGINCSADNTTITYDKSTKERYVLESELASAVDNLQDQIDNIPTPIAYTGASGVNIDNDTISLDDPIGVLAGDGITFTVSGDDIIISANVDTSNLATKTELASAVNEIGSAIDDLQDQIDNIPEPITYTGASGVNVDNDTISLDDPIGVLAGQGITFTASGDDIIISANADTSNLATKTELGSAIDELQSEINNIPAQVQADWNEADQSSKAYIQNKPSIPTKTSDLQNDSGFATTTDLEAYIPYSASGVELPNSNFEIGVDGQAYKLGEETVAKSPTFINYGGYDVALTKLETGVTYTLTVQGAYQWNSPIIYNHNSGTAYIIRDMFDANGVCVFTWPYETATVRIQVSGVSMNASNTTLTYVKASKERYVLESELASAVNEIGSAIDDLQDQIDNIPEQVQSDWTEADIDDPAYIQNKPVEKALVAGNNVTITDIGSAIEISSTGGSGSQVQADWTEDDSSDPSYIQNKPTEKNLVAGTNVTITETTDDVIVNTTEIASGAELVAGSGINIEEVNGNVRISATGYGETRTLLYTGSSSDARSGTFALSQSAYNFDRIELTCIDVNNYVIKQVADMPDATLVNANGTRGSWFNSVTSGTDTWFKAMNWHVNQAGTTLTYWVDEIATSGNSITAINRDQTGNRPIMLRIYGYKTNYGA